MLHAIALNCGSGMKAMDVGCQYTRCSGLTFVAPLASLVLLVFEPEEGTGFKKSAKTEGNNHEVQYPRKNRDLLGIVIFQTTARAALTALIILRLLDSTVRELLWGLDLWILKIFGSLVFEVSDL